MGWRPRVIRQNKFILFLFAGGASAVCNWGSARLISPYVGLGLAVAAGYLVGITVAYSLSRRFVFDRSGQTARVEFVRFCLVNVVSFAIVWTVTELLVHRVFPAIGFVWQAEAVAHAIGIAAPALPSFLLHRHFTFAAEQA
jgi:putative flippase GtrA